MLRIAVVIPAYNESESITDVIQSVNALRADAMAFVPVVVNDCSSDHTAEVAGRQKCVLLNLCHNLGIGGAVQCGLKYALHNDFNFAIQLDGDGQHPAASIPLLINKATEDRLNVVIGSRFLTGSGFRSTPLRRFGIRYFSRLIHFLCGINTTDATSGFRLFDHRAMSIANLFYPDEYPEPETVVLFARNKLRIGEVPVTMNERQGGRSSISGFGNLYYMVKVTMAMIFTYFRRTKTPANES